MSTRNSPLEVLEEASDLISDERVVDALMTEYKEWLSRQRYWAKLVMQSVTVLLAASALAVSFPGSKGSLDLLLAVLALFVAAIVIPSAWIYFSFREKSMRRLREIEQTLDEFGIHLGYQRTFDGVPIPNRRSRANQ